MENFPPSSPEQEPELEKKRLVKEIQKLHKEYVENIRPKDSERASIAFKQELSLEDQRVIEKRLTNEIEDFKEKLRQLIKENIHFFRENFNMAEWYGLSGGDLADSSYTTLIGSGDYGEYYFKVMVDDDHKRIEERDQYRKDYSAGIEFQSTGKKDVATGEEKLLKVGFPTADWVYVRAGIEDDKPIVGKHFENETENVFKKELEWLGTELKAKVHMDYY